MSDISVELWRHKMTGEQYLVTVDDTDKVLDAVGPLTEEEIDTAFRDGFDGDPDLVDDFNMAIDEDDFRHYFEVIEVW